MKFPGGTQQPPPAMLTAHGNQLTMAADDASAFGGAALEPPQTFEILYPQLRAFARRAEVGSVLLGAVDPLGRVVACALMEPNDVQIVGRHTECRVRLKSRDVSLRHLAVYVGTPTDEMLPTVRMWNLRTAHPFVTEDGVATEAVSAEGPLFATLGHFALAALPVRLPGRREWPEAAAEAWELLPRREFLTRLAEGTNSRREPGRPADWRISRITHLRATCDLAEMNNPAGALAEITIECRGRQVVYYVRADHLERGVLIGRYNRCCNEVISERAVSRVHLLIAACGRDVVAIDTASSCGTRTAGGEVASVTLGRKKVLQLANDTTVRWRRTRWHWA